MELLKHMAAVALASVLVWKVLGRGKLRRYLRRAKGQASLKPPSAESEPRPGPGDRASSEFLT